MVIKSNLLKEFSDFFTFLQSQHFSFSHSVHYSPLFPSRNSHPWVAVTPVLLWYFLLSKNWSFKGWWWLQIIRHLFNITTIRSMKVFVPLVSLELRTNPVFHFWLQWYASSFSPIPNLGIPLRISLGPLILTPILSSSVISINSTLAITLMYVTFHIYLLIDLSIQIWSHDPKTVGSFESSSSSSNSIYQKYLSSH